MIVLKFTVNEKETGRLLNYYEIFARTPESVKTVRSALETAAPQVTVKALLFPNSYISSELIPEQVRSLAAVVEDKCWSFISIKEAEMLAALAVNARPQDLEFLKERYITGPVDSIIELTKMSNTLTWLNEQVETHVKNGTKIEIKVIFRDIDLDEESPINQRLDSNFVQYRRR